MLRFDAGIAGENRGNVVHFIDDAVLRVYIGGDARQLGGPHAFSVVQRALLSQNEVSCKEKGL